MNESIVGCISGTGGCSGSDELDPPPPPPPQADTKNSNPKIKELFFCMKYILFFNNLILNGSSFFSIYDINIFY